MKVDLGGMVALITGAATGIGRACAEALVQNGATVVFSDRDSDRERESAAGRGDAVTLDVAGATAVTDGVAEVLRRHGRMDNLVNNAGLGSAPRTASPSTNSPTRHGTRFSRST
jgi:NAD(P)-dependent dehydrogenase (short-subunit alcohol dehydrogenase family)